jgi:hypothetical protein
VSPGDPASPMSGEPRGYIDILLTPENRSTGFYEALSKGQRVDSRHFGLKKPQKRLNGRPQTGLKIAQRALFCHSMSKRLTYQLTFYLT